MARRILGDVEVAGVFGDAKGAGGRDPQGWTAGNGDGGCGLRCFDPVVGG